MPSDREGNEGKTDKRGEKRKKYGVCTCVFSGTVQPACAVKHDWHSL